MKKTSRKSPAKTGTKATKKLPKKTAVAYTFSQKRKNVPEAGLLEFLNPEESEQKYSFDPYQDPRYEWAGKAERLAFQVPTLSLHVQDNVSTSAIIAAAERKEPEDIKSLFKKCDLSLMRKLEFYQHDVNWRNRIILGDSLVVMNSLLQNEQMCGKVQCVFMDPPYGIKFNSNFQSNLKSHQSGPDSHINFTHEPEQIQAYRDTWHLEIHSYLTYLRDRIFLAKKLLSETGAFFLQINGENLDVVSSLCGEIFGRENQIAIIPFRKKTMPFGAKYLEQMNDFILFYANDKSKLKYRQLFTKKNVQGDANFKWFMTLDGDVHPMTKDQKRGLDPIPKGARIFRLKSLEPSGQMKSGLKPYKFQGKVYQPPKNGFATDADGMRRLELSGRLQVNGNMLNYRYFLDDYPISELNSTWMDTVGADDKSYVVQTNTEVVRRCIMMTCDPGDLVFDPTCGSGTTAYVAEKWGVRWITCDTSRVAINVARQRLLTASFDYYSLQTERVTDGFHYRRLPHITLESIAKNKDLDLCTDSSEIDKTLAKNVKSEIIYDDPIIDPKILRVSGPFTIETINYGSLFAPSVNPNKLFDKKAETHGPSADEVDKYLETMTTALVASGMVIPGADRLRIESVNRVNNSSSWIHAEASLANEGNKVRRAIVSFGPQHAPISPAQVFGAIEDSRGEDLLIFVGFACDVEAQKIISSKVRGKTLMYVSANHDILSSDLLKTKAMDQLFAIHASPDFKIHTNKMSNEIQLELKALDMYDPNDGEVRSIEADSICAIFIDQDYDGQSFNISQALFPNSKKNAWNSMQRALRGSIPEEVFRAMQSKVSLAFNPGKRFAAKVIDERGNEAISIFDKSVDRETKGNRK